MSRLWILVVALAVTGCALPTYEAEPVSAEQWRRRQETVERQQAERIRLCRITKDEDPRKDELCRGVERTN